MITIRHLVHKTHIAQVHNKVMSGSKSLIYMSMSSLTITMHCIYQPPFLGEMNGQVVNRLVKWIIDQWKD